MQCLSMLQLLYQRRDSLKRIRTEAVSKSMYSMACIRMHGMRALHTHHSCLINMSNVYVRAAQI